MLEKFYFTQYSLQAFENCPLKFKKRYMENIRLTEPQDEEVRKQVQAGRDFHLLAHRYFSGICAGDMDFVETKLDLWFKNLKNSFVLEAGVLYLPEHKLRMTAGKFKLEANYDLIVEKDGNLTIWDWKTGHIQKSNGKESKSKRLKSSLQTVVYMYVMGEIGFLVKERGIKRENIRMCYWQPEPPEIVTEIRYSEELHKAYGDTLTGLVEDILHYDYSSFDKMLYSRHCKYCEFNRFCNGKEVDYTAVYGEEDEEA